MRLLLTRALPGALLLVLALGWCQSAPVIAAFDGPLHAATLIALGVVALLGVAFRRFRVTAAALVVAAAAWGVAAVGVFDPVPSQLDHLARNSVALLASLDLMWLSCARERSVLSEGSVARLLLILSQPLLVAYVWASYQDRLMSLLDLPLPAALGGRPAGVGALATLAMLTAAVVVAVRSWRTCGPVEIGLGLTLLALLVGVATPLWPAKIPVMLAAATVVLAVGLFQALFALAFLDQLTGLPTRRALDETLATTRGPFVVAMVDIDHFKACNDAHGHDVGDQVLRMVAGRLREVGGGGQAFRYGGEEFTIFFRGLTLDAARLHLEAVRKAVAGSAFTLRQADRPNAKPDQARPTKGSSETISVTVSAGVSLHSGEGAPADALRAADRALYRAKGAGRNRVVG